MAQIKAVGLLSGGLDSTLAARVLMDQGIEVLAINFVSPFCTCTPKSSGCASVIRAVKQLGDIPLKRCTLGDEYLRMVRAPKHGYGKGMNPCIDCRIMKIRKAAEYMEQSGASFLFTGEVLGQRPMSQHHQAIRIIDRESGISGRILRPLSAGLLAPTIPEQSGIVDRSRLLAIEGRSRKPQMALARVKGIVDYSCPAGGCLLTDSHFASRLRDYFDHCPEPSVHDMALLKIGRHIRFDSGGKVIISRNEQEGNTLLQLAGDRFRIYSPVNFKGPVVVLDGTDCEEARRLVVTYGKPCDVAEPQVAESVPAGV